MKRNLNLNEKNGTYAYCLNQNKDSLYRMFEDKTVTSDQYKKAILEVVEPANDTPAKKNFVAKLAQKKSKYDLLYYITNVMLCADHLSSDLNYRWSNEK